MNSNLMENLESRCLLSAALPTATVIEPASHGKVLDVTATPQGYTPAQIRSAYGFDQLTWSNGTIKADGAGQTIAIVAAYNDPYIGSDLSRFDAQFGIPDPPQLIVANQYGGTRLPKTNGDWALEISLDVEWAHAIAPGANILLVEANSESVSDLMAAVNLARSVPGVSVVSMSWGGNEWSRQLAYDRNFTTPAGHAGVTFVSASGDNGFGAEWPSSSPNVLAVGGTRLNLSGSAGTYAGETGWSGSGGGMSLVESEPTYQYVAQSTGTRTTPDVAYDANPSTGVAVYCSVPDSTGHSGWSEVGGTSAGTPQWAALVAIANQGRALNGYSSLDGPSQTLPGLYALYSAPGTAGYGTYSSIFHDIASGGSSFFSAASAGYDLVTGLGSPRAAETILALLFPSTPIVPATVSTPTRTPARRGWRRGWFGRSQTALAATGQIAGFSNSRIQAPAAFGNIASTSASPVSAANAGSLFNTKSKIRSRVTDLL